jgi:organic hydroperoxide reductase OsmC/OhrA
MLWFLSLARDAGFDVLSYRDQARGRLGRDADGRMAIVRIELDPEIRFNGKQPSPAGLAALHEAAHERCFIANSLRTEVVLRAR